MLIYNPKEVNTHKLRTSAPTEHISGTVIHFLKLCLALNFFYLETLKHILSYIKD